jgi:uncharacterized protein YqjF (DUF2071 family)
MSIPIDRLSLRTRPHGFPLMQQYWGKLLFAHWWLPPELVRPLIPPQLQLDLWEGRAYVGVVPFTMWGIRASFLPPIPGTSAFHELNVRTYVHYNGLPGVYFLSLDAAHRLAVWGARNFYYLPYFNADMDLQQTGREIRYRSTRTDEPPAALAARWTIGEPLPEAQPGTLEFFLTERYCLYVARDGELYRSRIFHPPWPLHSATLNEWQSTMLEAHGLAQPESDPLLHYAEEICADIWPLRRVRVRANLQLATATQTG